MVREARAERRGGARQAIPDNRVQADAGLSHCLCAVCIFLPGYLQFEHPAPVHRTGDVKVVKAEMTGSTDNSQYRRYPTPDPHRRSAFAGVLAQPLSRDEVRRGRPAGNVGSLPTGVSTIRAGPRLVYRRHRGRRDLGTSSRVGTRFTTPGGFELLSDAISRSATDSTRLSSMPANGRLLR